jgi:hypothetical protein
VGLLVAWLGLGDCQSTTNNGIVPVLRSYSFSSVVLEVFEIRRIVRILQSLYNVY